MVFVRCRAYRPDSVRAHGSLTSEYPATTLSPRPRVRSSSTLRLPALGTKNAELRNELEFFRRVAGGKASLNGVRWSGLHWGFSVTLPLSGGWDSGGQEKR